MIGFTVFLIGTAIFAMAFSTFGAWTWLVANGVGGILQFSLISYLNRTKRGKIFDSCQKKYNHKIMIIIERSPLMHRYLIK